MRLILLGPPGSGKGTQAELLSKKFHIPHVSTGNIFREEIRKKTTLGKQIEESLNKGYLVPDNIVNDLIKQRVLVECDRGFVLDGYPRTRHQAEFLLENCKIDYVINYLLKKEDIIKRISSRRTCRDCGRVYNLIFNPPVREGVCSICGGQLVQREDEHPDTIKKRLEIYDHEAAPLLDFFRTRKEIINIDASRDIDEIFHSTVTKLV